MNICANVILIFEKIKFFIKKERRISGAPLYHHLFAEVVTQIPHQKNNLLFV